MLPTFILLTALAQSGNPPDIIVVVGAAGTAEYAEEFSAWVENWKTIAKQDKASLIVISGDEDKPDQRSNVLQHLKQIETKPGRPLWIVLIGHGTFDGRVARFNLKGPDLAAQELDQTLNTLERPTVIACCFSASAPFINRVSGKNRVVISATKSGHEYQYSRFGKFFSEVLRDRKVDLDKDGQTSLLEAFLVASKQTENWYENADRLATEHALLDDNGDQKGTPGSWFQGVRVVKKSKSAAESDGTLANQISLGTDSDQAELTAQQLKQRTALEAKLERLRSRKGTISEEDYFAALEEIAVQLAKLYSEP